MADMISRLIVQLIDGISGPAKVAAGALRGLTGLQTSLGLASAVNSRKLNEVRGSLFNAGLAAYGMWRAMSAPISKAADFQTMMVDIGQKADLSEQQIGALGERIKALSANLGQSSMKIGEGIDNLMGRGLSPDDAMKAIPAITKTAAAYRATVDDISSASFSVMDNLKVAPDQLQKSLDVMATAGKMGAFELRNMAAEFPAITANAQRLGIVGVKGVAQLTAALQIARKGAGTGPEAATNTGEILNKVLAPEALKKFQKAGIDIREELKKTQKAGGDVFEMIARITEQATKGDQTKIGDFFQDKQAQQFLAAFIPNLKEYQRIRDTAAGSSGVVEADFAGRIQTADQAIVKFQASMERLAITIGTTLLPALSTIVDKIEPIVQAFANFAAANPQLVSGLLQVGAALVAINIAGIATRFIFLFMKGGFLTFASALLTLLNPLALVRGAMVALRLAVISTGIGAVLVAIAMAGLWIYNNWKGLSAMFQGFADAIKKAFPGLAPIIDIVVAALGKVVSFLSDMTGQVNMTEAQWRELGVSMGEAVAGWADKLSAMPGQIAAWFGKLPGILYDAGLAAINALWDGMAAGFAALMGKATAAAAAVGNAVKSAIMGATADPGSLAGIAGKYPTKAVPRLGGEFAAPYGRKAGGGRTDAGRTYMVGEKGPELFRSGVSGSITPNSAIGGRGVHFNPVVSLHVSGAGNPHEVAERAVEILNRKLAELSHSLFADSDMRTV